VAASGNSDRCEATARRGLTQGPGLTHDHAEATPTRRRPTSAVSPSRSQQRQLSRTNAIVRDMRCIPARRRLALGSSAPPITDSGYHECPGFVRSLATRSRDSSAALRFVCGGS
jgi:hypothetical protein